MDLHARFRDLLEQHISGLHIRGSKAAGLAPCHDDAHPSFSADLAKCVWYCHACCHGGGVRDFAMLVGDEWAYSRKPATRRERHQRAVAARRREAEGQARRVLSDRANRQFDDLCAQHREMYTRAGWAADLFTVFRRWPNLARQFPELLEQAEGEYGDAQDALAVLAAQLDGELEII